MMRIKREFGVAFTVTAIAALAAPGYAAPPDVALQVSPSGLQFLGQQAGRLVPKTIDIPWARETLLDCPLTDENTTATVNSGKAQLANTSVSLYPQQSKLHAGGLIDAQRERLEHAR
jgi:hypothetical protein